MPTEAGVPHLCRPVITDSGTGEVFCIFCGAQVQDVLIPQANADVPEMPMLVEVGREMKRRRSEPLLSKRRDGNGRQASSIE